ncbi:MAG: beta-galactosidase [Anaerolineae bacterium]|nr:beta-galactosidase [Anaerolineae bacterium]
MHLGVQYYRPPFPNSRYWEDDMKKIAASGLNTVQLWVVWGWVEAEPGRFRFDDYDRIVELADQNGLEVVLSTIAAIHPYWIHRQVPGSEMIDNMGNKVVSSNRGECHFGLTPGGCFDHPGIWERMKYFLSAVVEHYRDAPNLAGWDAWNELRWNVQSDGLVCYCPNTLNRFRAWLDGKYSGLDGLNAAWQRRYAAWEDVFPGKAPNRPYTEMMAFQDFISWRSVMHARARVDHIKALDPQRPVTVHGGQPTVLHGSDSYPNNTALHRGNDWFFADHIDGIGCSSFPLWGGLEMDRADFISRIDFLCSAANDKLIWLSELQGGRSNIGFTVAQSVPAASQQRWVWEGLSGGADTILFWCWRDEVFGRESTGFGLAGADGLAEERLAAMNKTGKVLQQYGGLLRDFKPAPARVGILFSPQSYYLYWSQDGTARTALNGIRGYARAMVRHNIPYLIVEENHLDRLDGIKILFLPRLAVLDDETARKLAAFVEQGGTLVCESECGAFGSNGLYRYPEDRHLAQLSGVYEIGRRQLEDVSVSLDGSDYALPAAQWTTPMTTKDGDATALLTQAQLGKGRIIFCGTYLGDAYLEASLDGQAQADQFEAFVRALIAGAGVTLPVAVAAPRADEIDFAHIRVGKSGGRNMAFVFSPQPGDSVELAFPASTFGQAATDILSGKPISVQTSADGERIALEASEWGIWVLLGTA